MLDIDQDIGDQVDGVAFASKSIDEQIMKSCIADRLTGDQFFPGRFIDEQTRRSCRVRFEDGATGHVDISVGTAGGKGEEFKTQDNRIGSSNSISLFYNN